jgi:uncharacterized phage-like protein YoqJ
VFANVDRPVVAFTGHRPDKLGGWNIPNNTQKRVRLALLDELIRIRPRHAIVGMALGVDQWAAACCHDLGIPFTAAIPCDDPEKTWPEPSQIIYHMLLAQAADRVVVSPGPYEAWKMQKRNEWMVDRCDIPSQFGTDLRAVRRTA